MHFGPSGYLSGLEHLEFDSSLCLLEEQPTRGALGKLFGLGGPPGEGIGGLINQFGGSESLHHIPRNI